MNQGEIKHLIMPGFEKRRETFVEDETISAFLERSEWNFNLPTICVVNGIPVLRKEWTTTTMSAPDNVVFYSRPHRGGGGGQKAATVGALVALVALAAFAPYAAGLLFTAGTFGFYATAAAITLGGGFLINTYLIPKAATNDTAAPISQLYSLTASGNTAAPFQPIPVQYGTLKVEPQYASQPWTDYIGNDAYLNILLCLGQGKYHVDALLIDDTQFWNTTTGDLGNVTDYQFQHKDPGDTFDLFPSTVIQSTEVDGQELATTTPIGYFIANPAGTEAYAFSLDFVFPGGLQGTDGNDGSHFPISVHLFAQVQQVDDAGTPFGPEITVVDYIATWNTNQPERLSEPFNLSAFGLPNGRYQVRAWRNPGPAGDQEHNVDTVLWQGLRTYVVGQSTFPCSVMGIRIKASAQLSANSAKRFGVIMTRILPVWDGSGFVEQPTKNAFWAFYDCVTNEDYGAQWPISKVDFQTIVDQASAADTRQDSFNYRFDASVTFQEAFDKILNSNRAKVRYLGDVISCVRDEPVSVPQMLIGDQQIIRGTLELDYIINDDNSSDCVQGQFLNEVTWQPAQLQYPPQSGSFNAQSPAQIQLDGVTNPDQMFRELQFWYKQSALRRQKVRFDTEHDGRTLSFGSTIRVQSRLPSRWGASGEIQSYNSGTHTLTVSRNLTDEIGQHYIELRDKRGRYFGPVKAGLGVQANLVVVDATDLATVETDMGYTLVNALDRMDGAEPPSFVYGKEGEISRTCIVMSGKPSGHKVSLELVVDNPAVHDSSGDTTPVIPSIPTINDPRVPIVQNLVASFKQGVIEPVLTASWWPAKGALFYKAQISYDTGATWTTLSDNLQDPSFTAVVSFANLRLRVAGISTIQGPYTFVDVEAPDIQLNIPIGPESLKQGLRDYVMHKLQETDELISQVVQQNASVAAEHDAARTTNTMQLRSVVGSVQASVIQVSTVVTDNSTAFAQFETDVNASIGDISADVTATQSALVTTDGKINASFVLTLDVNGYITGFQSINNGSTSVFQVIADKFVVAKPGVSGGSPISVFQIGTVGGVAGIIFTGNLYGDGSIQAQSLSVTDLSAVTGNMGTLNAGKVQSPDGKFLVDCTNKQIIISD